MNFSEFALKPNKNILRHISHHHSPLAKEPLPHDFPLRISEPKNKPNFIKINKNKLPNDFFQKKQSKRVSQQKIYLPQQLTEPLLHTRRIESERLICSPEKTSFFGFLEEKGQELPLKGISQPSKVLSRKFQTRQEPKRDAFLVEISRKVTGTSKTSKRDLLQLFPPTFDDRMNDMIAESSRSHIQRITPKKESALGQKGTQLFVNPEKTESNNEFKFPSARKTKELTIKLANMSFLEHQNGEGMNVTFYNAKSNCLPPINRQAS